ncbi:hypothetical protein ES332_D01G099800v1 [Gossypium tomentosum]|uniref:DEK C-terminal domain-containing protein n=1 Tax=Gossypium tomentosum TaxID=34277 RepID=A0A5D2M780_GOSTO|nr:hypothetical protein ES332_D01G099800v1 [Gossypium tomentosum]
MEEDKKDNENVETEKMDEDQECKQDKESKEEFEEGKEDSKTEAMEEEESHSKENDKEVEGKKETEQRTPLRDRPVGEHKSVERLVASIDKDASREFQIKKGRGIVLKVIPNVTFKLSRRKPDDTLRLHTILFGRRGKAVQVKSNISGFSGFVWLENEEKQKTKVKEKLLEFCDMLDITSTRATARKEYNSCIEFDPATGEDIIAKLIDFLEAPHATTAILLAEKDKSSRSRKWKRAARPVTKSNQSTKVTFTDILKLLVQRFDTDLTPRKLSIKLMIQEELTKLADDEDGEEDGEKDGAQSAGQELEA